MRWTVAQIAAGLHGPRLAVVPVPLRRKFPRAWIALYSTAGATLVGIAVLLFSGRDQTEFRTAANPAAAAVPRLPQPPREVPLASTPTTVAEHWFVVVATYSRQKDAERRASSISSRWPGFKADVYSPALQNQKPYYLVVIGSNLSQRAAVALQERARTAGVGRDAYVTRFRR